MAQASESWTSITGATEKRRGPSKLGEAGGQALSAGAGAACGEAKAEGRCRVEVEGAFRTGVKAGVSLMREPLRKGVIGCV
jgi:hypothetical protein